MSVVYRPSSSGGSSNRGNYNSRGGRHYRSAQDTTRSVRQFSGFAATVGIFATASLGAQFIGTVLATAGTTGYVVGMVVSGGSLIVTTVMVFGALKGRRAAMVLLPIGLLIISSLVPGLPVLIAAIYIGGSFLCIVYAVGLKLVQSRAFALAIAALPIVGGFYYVPTVLSNAGLVANFNATTTSIVSPDLKRIGDIVQKTYPAGAVVSYQIRDNRLYADIALSGGLKSIAIDTESVVKTPVKWLERDLSHEFQVSLGAGATGLADSSYARISNLLKPVTDTLKKVDTVFIADGALVNFPHQAALQSGRVFRSVSLDGDQIERNLGDWAKSPVLRPDQIKVLNALPQSGEQLQRLDLSGETWDRWKDLHGAFERAVPEPVVELRGASATKTELLDALQHKACTVMVIAHSDGFSIKLPTGETVDVKDLEQIKDSIRANRPRVFLFSCETARLSNVQSFAKTLLDYGAEAVAAPVVKVSANEALEVFQSFLNLAVGATPLPINQAFETALRQTGRKMMEVWVGELLPQDSEPHRSPEQIGTFLG